MLKRVLKIVAWIFVGLAGLMILVSILVYLPPVQRLIKNKASQAASESLGMELSIDRFRLRFPLRLTVDDIMVASEQGDTLLRAGRVSANLALMPLLGGKVEARAVGLRDSYINYADSAGTFSARGHVGDLTVGNTRVGLREKSIRVGSIEVGSADVTLDIGPSINEPEDTDGAQLLWRASIDRVNVSALRVSMNMMPDSSYVEIDLPRAIIANCRADLASQEVDIEAIRLQEGFYKYLSVPGEGAVAKEATEKTPEQEVDQGGDNPWTIRVGAIELDDNALEYGLREGTPRAGLDPDHIRLSQVSMRIDSVYNRSSELSCVLRNLSLQERSGLSIEQGSGVFSMDTTAIRLSAFRLTTPWSDITADAHVDASVLTYAPQASLHASLSAAIGARDVSLLLADPGIDSMLSGKNITAAIMASGRLDDLLVDTLSVALDGHVLVGAAGHLRHVTTPERASGHMYLSGLVREVGFLKSIPAFDQALERVNLPARISFNGGVEIAAGVFSPNVRIEIDSGEVDLRGMYDTNREAYSADVAVNGLRLGDILPADSLGTLSMTLRATGQGFDIMSQSTGADLEAWITEFTYQGYQYDTLGLTASLNSGSLAARLTSNSQAARAEVDIAARISENNIAGRAQANIANLDLRRMGFFDQPLAASLQMSADADIGLESEFYDIRIQLDSTRFRYQDISDRIGVTTLTLNADSTRMVASLRSEDLAMDFTSSSGPNAFLARIENSASELTRQVDSINIDMVAVNETLPDVNFRMEVGPQNIANRLASHYGIDFGRLSVAAQMGPQHPLHLGLTTNSFNAQGITLDTLYAAVRSREHQLQYFLRMANRPGNIDPLGLIYVYGGIEENDVVLNLFQRTRTDSVGFRLGVNAELFEDRLRATVKPDPVLVFEQWRVNPENHVTYTYSGDIEADLRLDAQANDQRIYLTSVGTAGPDPGTLNVEVFGINMAHMLVLVPNPPAVEGILSANLSVVPNLVIPAAKGDVSIQELRYNQKTAGDIGLRLDYHADSRNTHHAEALLSVNGAEAIDVAGTISSSGNDIRMDVEIPGFPLDLANMFLPTDTVAVTGYLKGSINAAFSDRDIDLDGSLHFDSATISSPLADASLSLSDDIIPIRNNSIIFDDFRIISSSGQPLTVSGSVDLDDMSDPMADVTVNTRSFDILDTPRSTDAMLYGRASLDASITARGPLSSMVVRGNARLLSGTDVGVTLRQSLAVRDQQQNIVTFVSFDDPDAMAAVDSASVTLSTGMDILISIDVDDDVRATVNLSADGNNRIELIGGGSLTFSENSLGDVRFTGRYDISGGRVLYNPPIISQKDFAITPGSYVSWEGDLTNPSFNITATETVRTSVSVNGADAELVTFQIMIMVQNSLNDMAITFDLASPDNSTIQSQLASMAPEQRSTQAMSLLLYNTYTGPGAETQGIDRNSAINNFITSEINQWARNNLNNVDVSLGINSYADPTSESGQYTDYSYQVSKRLFDDRVTIRVGGRLSSDNNAVDNLRNNFIDDISVEYRLSRRDNMFIKAFSYTEMENIMEGEVNKSGFGFVVRKKMDHLSELFRLNKEKKEERKQRRLERRAAEAIREDLAQEETNEE